MKFGQVVLTTVLIQDSVHVALSYELLTPGFGVSTPPLPELAGNFEAPTTDTVQQSLGAEERTVFMSQSAVHLI